jgi:hypothetical protein
MFVELYPLWEADRAGKCGREKVIRGQGRGEEGEDVRRKT